MLNSDSFVTELETALDYPSKLFSDPGLNGGGWHVHKSGGKLNTHLDYSMHPKLPLQRRLNLIVYLNSNWNSRWGGALGLWGNESSERPGKLVTSIEPKFNRAVLFDTALNSWHGLPEPITCPNNENRKSIAIYYLSEPQTDASKRAKALFAPTRDQETDPEILDLIKKRASAGEAHTVYKK